jgi:phage recombination protein Bet
MSTALAERKQLWTPTRNELAIVKSMNPKASTENLAILLNIAAYSGLNPIKGQLCMFTSKHQDKQTKQWIETVHIYTTIDGKRVIAHRSGRLDGIFDLQLSDEDGNWYECLPSRFEIPYAARASVAVKGCAKVFTRTVYWSEFGAAGAKYYDDGNPKTNWAKMPRHMLLKVAESHALSASFPDDLGNILTEDEVSANPEWAKAVRQQQGASTVTVSEVHAPAPEPKRGPNDGPIVGETPPNVNVQAERAEVREKTQRDDVAKLYDLARQYDSDGGDIDWVRVRKTLSSVTRVDIPAGRGEIDFSSWSADAVSDAVGIYLEIEREEAEQGYAEGYDDESLFTDGDE